MIISDQEVSWAYLLGPCFQLQNTKGIPLTGGYIEVYIHGTRDKYYCASDFTGTLHPFQIPLDSLGSNIVLASTEQAYDVYVYNRFGSLIMSRYNVIPVNGTSEGGGGTSNISITSSDGTITVTDTLDPETGIKTYDLSVPWASGDASYWHSRGASNQGQLINDTDTHVLAISEHAIDHEGNDITVGSDGKFHLKEGVYFWTVNVDLYSDSLSNNTQQIYINSNINRASYKMDMTRDNQHSVSFSGITVASQDDFQEGFTIKTEGQPIRASIYEVAIHKLNPKVLGTKYDAGYGIVIEDDTISVDPAVIPSVSTVSAMIQEAVTSIDGYATESFVTGYVDEAISEIPEQKQADWDQTDNTQVDYIKNKPDLDIYATHDEVTAAVTSIDLGDYTTHNEVYEATVTAINFVTGIIPEAQVQSDWTETDNEDPSYIQHKPDEYNLIAGQNIGITLDTVNREIVIAASATDLSGCATKEELQDAVELVTGMIPDVSDFTTNSDVHESIVTAIEYVTGIIPDAQVQSNWTETDNTDPSYIQNKPNEYTVVAGDNIGIMIDNNDLVISASGVDLSDYTTFEDVVAMVSGVTGLTEYGQFYASNITGAATMSKTKGTIEVTNDGNIKLKKGSSYHVTVRGRYNQTTAANTYGDISYIEYITGQSIHVNVDKTITEAQYFELSYDLYKLNNDSDYYVFFSMNGGTVNDLFIEIHSLDGIGGSGTGPVTGGTEYDAGWGIQILNNVISVNPSIIPVVTGFATKEELQDGLEVVTGLIPDTSDLATKVELQNNIELVTGLIPTDYVSDEELQDSLEFVTGQIPVIQLNSSNMVTAINSYPIYSSGSEGTTYTGGDGIDIVNNVISVDNTVALKTDMPVVTGFATEAYVTGYIDIATQDFITEEQVTALIPEEEEVEFLELTAGNNISIANGVVSVVDMPVVTGFATKDELQDGLELVTGLIPTVQLNSNDQVTAINNYPLAGGGGGTSYTAGDGIDITNDVISVDDTVVTTAVTSLDFQNMGFKIDNGGQAYKYGGEYRSVTKANEAQFWEPNQFVINNVDGIERIAYTSSNLPENTEVVCLSLNNDTLYTGSNGSIDFTVISEEDWTELYRITCRGLNPIPSTVTFVYDTFAEEAYATETYVTGLIPDVSNLVTKEELQDSIELVTGLIPDTSDFITYSASGVELTNSNFKIDPDGQAYKNESTTATITPTGTYSGGETTTFNMADLQRTAYTSNITNGYAKLTGTDINIRIENADGSFDLSNVSDSEWNNATELIVGSYWPTQEAVISYTGTTKAYVPYISAEVPSNTGTYVLKCINGVIQWISES